MKTVFDRDCLLFTMFKIAVVLMMSLPCASAYAAGKIDIKIADNRGLQQKIDARYEHEGDGAIPRKRRSSR